MGAWLVYSEVTQTEDSCRLRKGKHEASIQESVAIRKMKEQMTGNAGPQRKLRILGFKKVDGVQGVPFESKGKSQCTGHTRATDTGFILTPQRTTDMQGGISPVLCSSLT